MDTIETYLETLDYDCVLVIEKTCSFLILNRSNILLQSATHNHSLPLAAISWDATILATSLASHPQILRFVPWLDHKLLLATICTLQDSSDSAVLVDFGRSLKLADQISAHLRYHIIVLHESCSTSRRNFSDFSNLSHNLLAWLTWWQIWPFLGHYWLLKTFLGANVSRCCIFTFLVMASLSVKRVHCSAIHRRVW